MSLTFGNEHKIIVKLLALLTNKCDYSTFIFDVHPTVWHKQCPPYCKALYCRNKNGHWTSTKHFNHTNTSASPLMYLLTSTVQKMKLVLEFVP